MRFEISALEPRVLLCGSVIHTDMTVAGGPDHYDNNPIVLGPEKQWGPTFAAQEMAESSLTSSSGLPLLHSNPGAFATLFLDFDGSTLTGNNFPAYNIDASSTTFNATEAANITEMWQRTAEKFAPFNVDITTEDPGPRSSRHIAVELIGSTGGGGGYAYVNSFSGGGGYGVTEMNQYTSNKIAADIITHEAGHMFGLWHQSLYDANGVKLQEYYSGDSQRAPIMGYLYNAQRALWWNGTSSLGSTINQNDLDIISGTDNGFGYRPDDHGSSLDLADPVDFDGVDTFTATGLIETGADQDVFSFFAGGGTIDLTLDNFTLSPSLDAAMYLYQSQDGEPFTLVASAATSSLDEFITYDSGDSALYKVVVASQGNYGDVGQYTLTGVGPILTAPTASATTVLATPVSATRVDLSWVDNASNETGYRIERTSDGGANWSVVGTVGANAIGFSDLTTSANQTYYYRVVTTASASDSDPSNLAKAATTLGPSNSRQTFIGYTKVTLAWDVAAGAAGYLIEKSTDGSNWTRIAAAAGTATSYQVTGLAVDTDYSFRIRTTKDGYSLPGATVLAHTNFLAAPAAPLDFVATTRSAYSNNLAWSDTTGEDTYRIERSTDGVNWGLAGNPAQNAATFIDWNWTPDTLFYYRIAGINEAGQGEWSAIASARTAILTPPEAPTNLRLDSYYGPQFALTWDDNSETESDFLIEEFQGGQWVQTSNVGEESYPWWWSQVLDYNTSYTYRVRATNAAGTSDPSNAITLLTPPPMPANFQISATVHTAINLSWDDVPGEVSYRIEREFEDYDIWEVLGTVGANVTSFTDTTAAADTWYNYRVFATNSERDSEQAFLSFTTPSGTPVAPTGLAVTQSTSQRALILNWNDVAGDASYKIERSADGATGWTQIATTGANVNTYTNTGLTSGATWHYRVRASNTAGDSGYSNVSSGIVPTITAPAAPTNLAVDDVDVDFITIVWDDNSNNETGFSIESLVWDPYDHFWYMGQVATVPAGSFSWTDTSHYAGETASYRVRAYNDGGYSAYSNQIDTQTRPDSVFIAATAVSNTQINLSWTDVQGNDGYRIERSLSGTGAWSVVGTALEIANAYSDTGLSPNVRYYYRVFATSPVGDSSASNVANALTLNVIVPSQPTGLVATGVSTSQINLSWNDVTTETSYTIERSPDGSTGWASVGTTGANVTTFSNTLLSAGTTYYYRVLASNSAGSSTPSATANAITITTVPTGLATSVASTSQINLTWSDVTGESGYKVERSSDGGANWTQIGTTGANVVAYNDTGLNPGTTYTYRVRATNASGDSAYSNIASGTTITLAPPGLVASAMSTSQINLSWTDVVGDAGYKIERSTDGANWSQIATTATSVTSYSDTLLGAGITYLYRVRATNAGGDSAYSSVAQTTTITVAPAGLTASAVSSSQINLSWTDVTGDNGYLIERSPNGTSGWTQVGTTAVNVTTYSNTGLNPSTAYYYRVRSTNAGGQSAYSNTANATTQASVPNAPSNLTFTVLSNTSVRLNWLDNATNETGFKIERSTNGTTWSQIATVGANVATYTNTGLNKNTRYYYRVRAYNAVGNSAYSNVVNVPPR